MVVVMMLMLIATFKVMTAMSQSRHVSRHVRAWRIDARCRCFCAWPRAELRSRSLTATWQ